MADMSVVGDGYESEDSSWGEEDQSTSQILGDTATHHLSAAKSADGRTAAQGAQWFNYKPATYPPSLNKFAEQFNNDWAAGKGTITFHRGGRSKKNLLRWFQAWMGRIKDAVTTKDGSTFFVSSRNANDQGRHHRWVGHLKEFMYRTSSPSRDQLETEEEYKALLKELQVIRDEVVGWTANFILYSATSFDTRTHICATLSEGLVELGLPTTLAKAGDWRPLVMAYLADVGPEPNHQDLTAPVKNFAWSVHKQRHMPDITSALFAEMRRSASALELRLSDIDFDVVWRGGPACKVGSRSTSSSSSGGGGAEARGGADDDDGEDVGVPASPESFSRKDVEHIIEQTRAQTIAHIVFGQHMGCTFDARFRRELQNSGIGLRPDGAISFEEPLPRADPLRATRAVALDNLVRLQCVDFCERQSNKRQFKSGGGRPASRGQHRETAPVPAPAPSGAVGSTFPPPAPVSHGGAEHAGAAQVTLVAQARPPPHKKLRHKLAGEFCHHCDVDAEGRYKDTRVGHNTRNCPLLTPCPKCNQKHTTTFDCEALAQRKKGGSGGSGGGSGGSSGGGGGSGSSGGGGGSSSSGAARRFGGSSGGSSSSSSGAARRFGSSGGGSGGGGSGHGASKVGHK